MNGHGGVLTRLLVVDDHDLYAEVLALALSAEDDFEVVGRAASLAEARTLVTTAAPDVILLDQRLPDGSGVGAIAGLRALRPDAAVIVLTAAATDSLLTAIADAGGHGPIAKTSPLPELLAAVRTVSPVAGAGLRTATATAAPALAAADRDPAFDPRALRALSVPGVPEQEDVLALAVAFVGTVTEQLAELRAATAAGDVATVAEVAHRIAGGGAGVGARRLVRLARTVEDAAREGSLRAELLDPLDESLRDARRGLAAAFPWMAPHLPG